MSPKDTNFFKKEIITKDPFSPKGLKFLWIFHPKIQHLPEFEKSIHNFWQKTYFLQYFYDFVTKSPYFSDVVTEGLPICDELL